MIDTLIDRRNALRLGSAALLGSLSRPLFAASTYDERRYAKAMTIDGQGVLGGNGALTLAVDAALAVAGMTAISMTVGRVGEGEHLLNDTVAEAKHVADLCAQRPDRLLLIRSYGDLIAAKRSGRTGIILNLQDSNPLEGKLDNIALLKGLGIRVIQLTYNRHSLAGDGAIAEQDAGLSDFGRSLIAELERQHVLVDLSHGGRRTIADALGAARRPLTISHTGCRALADLPRNVDDASLRRVADGGGVVGIYLMPFLRVGGQPHAPDLIAHIEHALSRCGEDHVGIGTDGTLIAQPTDAAAYAEQRQFYDSRKARGIAAPGEAPDVLNIIPEYNTPRRFLSIACDLAARGHPPRRIDKILGGNVARLYAESWTA